MKVERYTYGTTSGGEQVDAFTLVGEAGISAKVIAYGATLLRLETPDRHGQTANLVLAHADLEAYEKSTHYLGATVGRYANRIGGSSFSLDGRRYPLTANEGRNHLHGGTVGFDKRVWQAEPFETEDSVGVEYSYTSPDGEQGYPGTLEVRVTYRLSLDAELQIDYAASTDMATHVNLTNHSYFNLGGHDSGDVLDHELTLECDHFLPVDGELIPTGEVVAVAGSPLDFRQPKRVGEDIAARGEGFGELYDVCLVATAGEPGLSPLADVHHPGSGRRMEVLSTQPAVQLYTGNHFAGVAGADGAVYKRHQGLALETQHFPDSPNRPTFPSTLLEPGQRYEERTVFRFSVA